jgi:hypothetical protein
MGSMRTASALAVLLAVITLWPAPSPAQGGSDGLSMEQRRKRELIRPLPPAAEIERDTDQAVEALQAERRRDELMRENLPHIKPPYADSDVTGGIQSQSILKALPRR